jgi:aryl-alcohol dehydrogenase-like predicted oxidoreductase
MRHSQKEKTMKHHALGQTGLYVSELTLGTMTFAPEDSASAALLGGTGQKLADRMVALAIERGINLFDSANIYGMGQSEIMLGKALGARRNEVVIATKFYHTFGSGPNDLGGSRMAIVRELEGSLRRLGTEWIDLYQLHNVDPTTPLDETLRALDDVIRQGKVRYIGVSNFPAWQIARADAIARALGSTRFCSAQIYYSLAGREVEREILPAVRELGLGTMIWGPLASGFLSGKYGRDGSGEGRRARMSAPPVSPRGHDIVGVLRQTAEAHDSSLAQIALAWLRHQNGVTTTIVGATKEEQLRNNLESIDIELSAEELTRLDNVSALVPEYPAWMVPMRRGENMASRMASLLDGG